MKTNRRLFQQIGAALVATGIFFTLFTCPLNAYAETDAAQADFTPWSGWWWPSNMGGLATGLDYNGHPAPLEKYDLLANGSYPGDATQYYLDTEYDPDALDWNGFCHAYASAAVYERIKFYPSSNDNIYFNVGDKKGLITACHEHDQRLYGKAHSAVEFHYWLLHYIKDQGKAFYAELDPTVEVWNFPVYRYEMETTKNGAVLDVQCKIWYASDFVHPDFQGTDAKTNSYTYTLILSGDDIVDGEWTGNSVYDHPQLVVMPLDLGVYNPYLDYDRVREITVSRDDPHEADEPAELLPGGYNQILADKDTYTISVLSGETVYLTVENLDDFAEGMQVSVLDNGNRLVQSATVSSGERAEFSVTAADPPYTLSIARSAYDEAGRYRLEYDLKRVYTFTNTNIQKGYGWGGFAISNDGEANVDSVCVTGYDKEGRPLETYEGPFQLPPGEKRTVFFADFDVRMVDRDALFGAKVHATQPVNVVNLSGYYNTNMIAPDMNVSGTTFVVPDMLAGFGATTSLSWGIFNPTSAASTVSLTHYASSGAFVAETDLSLSPHQALHYNAGSQPLSPISNGGWVKIDLNNGSDVGGYTQWLAKSLKQSERLPLLSPATRLAAPHVVRSTGWEMHLILINTDSITNPVTIRLLDGSVVAESTLDMAPHEKRTFSLGELFEAVPAERINRCGLRVDSGQPLAGYYTFETDKDYLSYPLLDVDSADTVMTVPHVACAGNWWTAVNLFNPSESLTATLRLIPYDSQGNVMDGQILTRQFPPLTKDVWSISAIWGDAAGTISMLKIEVTSGPPVVGLYGYGNMDNSMLAGVAFKGRDGE